MRPGHPVVLVGGDPDLWAALLQEAAVLGLPTASWDGGHPAPPSRLILLNLDQAGSGWADGVTAPVLALTATVSVDGVARARAAGARRVLPRDEFLAELPAILRAVC